MNKLTSTTFLIFFISLVAGYVHAQVDLVKIDKSDRKMYLFDGDELIKEYRISLGANPKGHKEKEGDEKTPEGTYTLDFIKKDSTFYRAMHISYPNENDIQNAKNNGVNPGGSIMVHGQRNKLGFLSFITQNFNWTDGCIGLTNSEMGEFLDLVETGTKIQIDW